MKPSLEEGGCPPTEAASYELRITKVCVNHRSEGAFLMIFSRIHCCLVRANKAASLGKIYCFQRNFHFYQPQARCSYRVRYSSDSFCAIRKTRQKDRNSSLLSSRSTTSFATLPCSQSRMRRALDAVVNKAKSIRAVGAPLVPLVGALGLLGTMASLLRQLSSQPPSLGFAIQLVCSVIRIESLQG